MNESFKRKFGTSFKYFDSLNSFKYKINKINHFQLKGNSFENNFLKENGSHSEIGILGCGRQVRHGVHRRGSWQE
jgi:hypothetical protein